MLPEEVIEIRDDQIDVKKIMEKIREDIRSRKMMDCSIFEEADLGAELERLNFNNTRFNHHLHRVNQLCEADHLPKLNSNRKIAGKFVSQFKRCVFRIMSWYIGPIVLRQNVLNSELARTLNEIRDYIELNERRVQLLIKENQLLSDQVKKPINHQQRDVES